MLTNKNHSSSRSSLLPLSINTGSSNNNNNDKVNLLGSSGSATPLPPALELFTKIYQADRRTKITILLCIVLVQIIVYWLYIKHYISDRVFLHDELLQDRYKRFSILDDNYSNNNYNNNYNNMNNNNNHHNNNHIYNNNNNNNQAVGCYHMMGVKDSPQFKKVQCLLHHVTKVENTIVEKPLDSAQSFEQGVKSFAREHHIPESLLSSSMSSMSSSSSSSSSHASSNVVALFYHADCSLSNSGSGNSGQKVDEVAVGQKDCERLLWERDGKMLFTEDEFNSLCVDQ